MSVEQRGDVIELLAMDTIAVVGLSKDPSKPSHDVAKYLQSSGYGIIPINPTVEEVLGEKSYPSLLSLPDDLKRKVEVVDIFRRSEDVPPIIAEAIKLHQSFGHPKGVWMQLGIVNEAAAQQARDAGLRVVMDRCMKIEHTSRR